MVSDCWLLALANPQKTAKKRHGICHLCIYMRHFFLDLNFLFAKAEMVISACFLGSSLKIFSYNIS